MLNTIRSLLDSPERQDLKLYSFNTRPSRYIDLRLDKVGSVQLRLACG